MGPGREFDDFSLRIDSSIGELLLLLYKSGFYRREQNSHRKITHDPHSKPLTQTASLFARVKKGARPAEVGALASVFEKSATELKQSKLLKCKQTLQIATFNVRTLNRIGQLPELIASAEEHKIDIICIQEHRYTHTEDIKYHETSNGWSLATVSAWKNSVNAAVGGGRDCL